MKNVPEKIYLQIDADGETPEDFAGLEVTWCAERINENDITYIRESSSPTVKESETSYEDAYREGWNDAIKHEKNIKESETGEQEERIKVLEEALREIIDYQMNFVELACTTTIYKIADKALRKPLDR